MADRLRNRIAWVTGAGTGIGAAAAVALAGEGALVVLTGRRREPLEATAATIQDAGGRAEVQPADLTDSQSVAKVANLIAKRFGQLDILVNNAGVNILNRRWTELDPSGVDRVVHGNLSSAFYCAGAAIEIMRPRGEGLLIHTASMAGRLVRGVGGPAYTAAKHGVVAMSHSINLEEADNGIRSCVICPGEVDTPILDNRPVPVSAEARAKLLTAEDVGELILYVACQPPRVRIDEVWITPTRR